jgi:hypothetical protein
MNQTGGSAAYWHVDRDYQAYNSPKVNIIYPNSIYSMNGYPADGLNYINYSKVELNYNPYVQYGCTAYILVEPEGQLIQNFTVNINRTAYTPCPLTNTTLIESNYSYPTLVSQSGFLWETNVLMPDFYSYYFLNMQLHHEYSVQFRMNNDQTVTLECDLLNNFGSRWIQPIDNYYGFFIVNNSYAFTTTQIATVYFKFDSIAYGKVISIRIIDLGIPDTPIIQTPSQNVSWIPSINLTWTPRDTATSYKIYINNSFVKEVVTAESILEWAINGTYSVTVTAVNRMGESNPSIPILINVAIPLPLIPPIPIIETPNVIVAPDNVILIDWNDVENATGYRIFINDVWVANSTESTYAFVQSIEGTYIITVSAMNAGGESNVSTPIEIIVRNPGAFEESQNSLRNWMIASLTLGGVLTTIILVKILRVRNARKKKDIISAPPDSTQV